METKPFNPYEAPQEKKKVDPEIEEARFDAIFSNTILFVGFIFVAIIVIAPLAYRYLR